MDAQLEDIGNGDEGMVLVAALVSRVEALVVSSMLEAAGIAVNIGALHHASVSVNSLALGGHRLWVPQRQHLAASEILLEVLGEDEWSFSHGLRRAVLRFIAYWAGLHAVLFGIGFVAGAWPLATVLWVPLSVLSVPVNPQGRGDYFLAEDADYPAD